MYIYLFIFSCFYFNYAKLLHWGVFNGKEKQKLVQEFLEEV